MVSDDLDYDALICVGPNHPHQSARMTICLPSTILYHSEGAHQAPYGQPREWGVLPPPALSVALMPFCHSYTDSPRPLCVHLIFMLSFLTETVSILSRTRISSHHDSRWATL